MSVGDNKNLRNDPRAAASIGWRIVRTVVGTAVLACCAGDVGVTYSITVGGGGGDGTREAGGRGRWEAGGGGLGKGSLGRRPEGGSSDGSGNPHFWWIVTAFVWALPL